MPSVPGPEFGDAVADLPAADLAALVAAVHEARGWAVERDGTDVLATPPRADRPLRLVVRAAGADADAEDVEGEAVARSVPAGTDRLAVPTRAPDAGDDVLDAADLRAMVAHALDPADRARICRRFFDRDPEAFGDGSRASGPAADATATDRTEDGDAAVDGPDAGGESDADPPAGEGAAGTVAESGGGPPDAADAAGADDRRVAGRDGTGGVGSGRAESVPDETGDAGAGGADAGDADGRDRAGGDGREREGTERDEPDGRRQLLLAGVALALVIGGIAAATGPALTSPDGVGAASDATVSTGAGVPATAATASSDRVERPVRQVLPPGLGAGGITDLSTLAGIHQRALLDRSYRIRIVHREYVDGRLRGVAYERVAVESADRYRSSVRTFGTLDHAGMVISDESTYANGSTYINGTTVYVRSRSNGTVRLRRGRGTATAPTQFVNRTGRYVRQFLDVDDSRIAGTATRDGSEQVWVVLHGKPAPGVTSVLGRARVDEVGVVREIRRTYDPADSPVRVEITIRITPGPVTITPPAWADEGNVTATTETTPTPTASSSATAAAARPPPDHRGAGPGPTPDPDPRPTPLDGTTTGGGTVPT